jgi:hypothetical protein
MAYPPGAGKVEKGYVGAALRGGKVYFDADVGDLADTERAGPGCGWPPASGDRPSANMYVGASKVEEGQNLNVEAEDDFDGCWRHETELVMAAYI